MTVEEMHIAVCEWMGWSDCSDGTGIHPENVGVSYALRNQIPTLTLDWIHECVKRLGDGQWEDYHTNLVNITGGNADEGCDFRPVVESTKEQRLEALCRKLFPEKFK